MAYVPQKADKLHLSHKPFMDGMKPFKPLMDGMKPL